MLFLMVLSVAFLQSNAQDLVGAKPVGGDKLMRSFINQIFEYPTELYEQQIEGDVSFLFNVEEDGTVSNIHNITSPHHLALEKTLRIFRLIEWIPATRGGRPVVDIKKFTLEFNIKKYDKLCKQRQYSSLNFSYIPVDTSTVVHWYRHLEKAPLPLFKDKTMNITKFIAQKLQYPDAAIRQNVTGIVRLNFIVEPSGKVSNIKTIEAVGAGCTEEAIRILTLIDWQPGILGDMAVRTRSNLSINFELNKNGGRFEPNIKSSYGE